VLQSVAEVVDCGFNELISDVLVALINRKRVVAVEVLLFPFQLSQLQVVPVIIVEES